MFAATEVLPRPVTRQAPTFTLAGDLIAGLALLTVALVIGLTTASHYGVTIDEFNTDDYGPKALAWYTSGFTDRSHFETVEEWLWAYGPWFQILVAFVQSLGIAEPFTVRHALNFLVGIAGLAALIPLARLTVGRWASPVAIGLCLMTGYVYGHLFFTPVDVPFMAAMMWSLVAIAAMARLPLPAWSATIGVGLATGLAIATRTGGIITHALLVGAMALCALEMVARDGRLAASKALRLAAHMLAAMAIAWVTAIALWPWLQIGNPFHQFAIAYQHFADIDSSFRFVHWGEHVSTVDLPWNYVPMQLLARLPEGFLLLIAAAIVVGFVTAATFMLAALRRYRRRGLAGLRSPARTLARARGVLIVVAAVVLPLAFVIIQGSTLYDGVRHLLFIIPLLALLAAGALIRMLPRLRAYPILAPAAAVLAAAHVGSTAVTLGLLHPLEYVAMNAFAGGTAGAQGRFEQDYWSAAGTTALRQLERRLAYEAPARFSKGLPRVMMCIPWREHMAAPMLPPGFLAEADPDKADYLIGTERWDCGKEKGLRVVDEVERLGRSFAWTYANNRGKIE